jgi:hypothetical protein
MSDDVTKDCRALRNGKRRNLYISPDILWVIKKDEMNRRIVRMMLNVKLSLCLTKYQP